MRAGRVTAARRDRRQPDSRRGKTCRRVRLCQLLQQRLRLGGPTRGKVVVREHEAVAALLGYVSDGLQVRLGVRRSIRRKVKHGERAIRRDVLWIDRKRRLQLALGGRKTARIPVEVCQRQPRGNRFGVGFGGFLERRFGLIAISPRQLERGEIGVAGAAVRAFANGRFDFGNGCVKVLEAGQRVAFGDLCLDIVWSHRQGLFRARLRVFEPSARAGENSQP